jgi:hypothetical protein
VGNIFNCTKTELRSRIVNYELSVQQGGQKNRVWNIIWDRIKIECAIDWDVVCCFWNCRSVGGWIRMEVNGEMFCIAVMMLAVGSLSCDGIWKLWCMFDVLGWGIVLLMLTVVNLSQIRSFLSVKFSDTFRNFLVLFDIFGEWDHICLSVCGIKIKHVKVVCMADSLSIWFTCDNRCNLIIIKTFYLVCQWSVLQISSIPCCKMEVDNVVLSTSGALVASR